MRGPESDPTRRKTAWRCLESYGVRTLFLFEMRSCFSSMARAESSSLATVSLLSGT